MMCTICFRKKWPWPHHKVTTECNHSYCRKCLINWVKSENWACNKCPVCRRYLNQEWRNMLLTDRYIGDAELLQYIDNPNIDVKIKVE